MKRSIELLESINIEQLPAELAPVATAPVAPAAPAVPTVHPATWLQPAAPVMPMGYNPMLMHWPHAAVPLPLPLPASQALCLPGTYPFVGMETTGVSHSIPHSALALPQKRTIGERGQDTRK